MGVIMVVCAAFGLNVSEAKPEIMCLRVKGMPESTAIFSVEAAGQVYNQTNEFVYLGGNVNHNADLSIEVDRRIRNAWCSFRKYTLELYYRPSARGHKKHHSEGKNIQRPLRTLQRESGSGTKNTRKKRYPQIKKKKKKETRVAIGAPAYRRTIEQRGVISTKA